MSRPRRGKLAWRLYALGLVQLVLLGGTVAGVGYLLRPAPPSHLHAEDFPPPPTGVPPPDARPGVGLGPPPGPPRWGPPPSPPGEPHRGPPSGIPLPPLLTFFFSGLVILGIGSLLTARWIVRPLVELSRTARSLGDGDLRARTGLDRDDELGDVARAFDDMAERIQSLRRAERELLANISHELRTPLARIRVALDIAGEGDAETGRVSVSEIGVDLAELEALLEDVLTTARLELADGHASAPGFELHREAIAPDVLCRRALERFRASHPARPLETKIGTDLPLVDADPVLFRRVLDNLLANAHKYSPDQARPIVLRAGTDGARVAFEIADGGVGISGEDLPHVFAPFFRGERSRSRAAGGVGLGLTLAKRIVEAHGGEIAVASTAGMGTTVRVVIPARA